MSKSQKKSDILRPENGKKGKEKAKEICWSETKTHMFQTKNERLQKI